MALLSKNDEKVLAEKNLPLYNSRIIHAYLALLKDKYPHIDVNKILRHAHMDPCEVADQGHWFSQEQVDLFYEKLVQLTGDESIAREAGRHAASPEALGAMRQYLLGLVGPARVFNLIQKTSVQFTRSSEYSSRELDSNRVEITVTPRSGVQEKEFQCENRMGFFEAIIMMFNFHRPGVTHPECLFRGDPCCRYVVSWEDTLASLWAKIRLRSIPLFFLLVFGSLLYAPGFTLTVILPALTIILFGLTVIMDIAEKKELRSSLSILMGSTEKLVDQININHANASLTNEIGQALSQQTDIDSILDKTIKILENYLDYQRGMILLANPDRTTLEYKGGFGYTEEQEALLKNTNFDLTRAESAGIFIRSFREKQPFLINDLKDIGQQLSERSLKFASFLGVKSFICCPIISEEETVGILAVDNLKAPRPLVHSDMSLLMGITPFIGISMHNVKLMNARVEQFKSTLQVLAASIDARDPLTAGHSEKVTEYALGICQEMDLPQDFTEMIRVAALLHDYGKLGVPDSILKKEGRLTSDEYEAVKTHSLKTRTILEQINFEGVMAEVPIVAGAHHEKYDGTGYPEGLIGEQIPLGARILAVADFFEAITAKRHYREPMPLDVAFELLREGIGRHFDARVVIAFMDYYTRAYLGKPATDPGRSSVTRNDPRVPIKVQLSIEFSGASWPGYTVDMGPGGLYATSNQTVSLGQRLHLSFDLPGPTTTTIRVQGRVAWVNNMDIRRKPSYPLGFGIEFTLISDAEKRAIADHLKAAPSAVAPY
ncbi:hypothetical protein AOP6_2075 [Desulfuromonas sp. AOP6]|nr:hypothetical protein AOP6_2075 [Desulfuromonas sp. AOP6]